MTIAGAIVCFGELLIRLSPPDRRLIVQSGSMNIEVGGAEANVAAALASLGANSRMISAVPDNPLGRKARAAIAATNADVRHIHSTAHGRMGLYFFEQGAGSRPSTVTYDRAGSAFSRSEPADFEFDTALNGAALLHLSGITPALGPKGVDLVRAAIRAAKAASVPLSFDGNYRAQLWESWPSDPASIMREILESATILIGNHRDISLVLDQEFKGDGPERRRAAAEAAFAAFPHLEVISSTARQVVTSDHHRISARIDRRSSEYQTPDIDVTGIIDRIGTGDAFAAGIVHGWVNNVDDERCANRALAMSALKHSLPGDLCLLSLRDIDSFQSSGHDVKR